LVGLGHLMRCKRLAIEFEKYNHKCIFFVDKHSDFIEIDFTKYFLYSKNNDYKNEINDAKRFTTLTKSKPGIVILDDHRFSEKWEKAVSKFHKKIVNF